MKKGFTLVELLVTISLIGVLSSFIIVDINKKSKDYSKEANNELIELIKSSTYSYIMSNEQIEQKVKSSDSGYTIKLEELINNGYLDEKNLKNFETKKTLDYKDINVVISYGLNDEGTAYEYQYQINGIK